MGAEQDVLLRLDARTTLSPRDALGVVKDVVGGARVAGVSMDKWTEIAIGAGQRIVVDGEDEKGIALSIMNMKIVQFCTFSAEVRAIEDGTWLRVGALESYKIGQDKLLYFIPLGPKKVPGLGLYKRFLQAVAGVVRSADPNASVSVGIGDPSRP